MKKHENKETNSKVYVFFTRYQKKREIKEILKYKNIGITSGASAPESLVFDLINIIKKNVEVEVKEIEVANEKVSFKLPKILN